MKKPIFIFLSLLFLLQSCVSKKKISQKSKSHAKLSEAGIKNKYASLLGVNAENISNLKLYSFMDDWMGVPHKYGGRDKDGVDCSGFTSQLMTEIYGKKVQGPSYTLYDLCMPIAKDQLREGDLVFFKIESEKISHVGIYLQNNKFIHASIGRGVIISDLAEAYYLKYFFSAGRLY